MLPPPLAASPPSPAELVATVAQSTTFGRSRRHAALLEFLASQADADLKETLVGHRFFDRPADYDPKVDPVVRVEIRRLRERLDEFYASEGASQAWRLQIPKGSYRLFVAPSGAAGSIGPEQDAPSQDPPSVVTRSRRWAIAGIVVAVGLVLVAATSLRQPAAWFGGRIRSLAVLPIEVVGGQGPQDLTAGLEQDIAAALSNVDGLLVVGPAAARRADLQQDPRAIARALGVDAVMTGSMAQEGGRVRLRVQVTRATDGAIVLAQSDERDRIDTFALQNELAGRVASAFNLAVLRTPKAVRAANNQDTLLDYRRGLSQIDRRNATSILQAIDSFHAASAREPDYGPAWAALAEAYAMLPDYVPGPADWAESARDAGRRALELDPDNPDALAALGWVDFQKDLAVGNALRLLNQALSVNPNHLTAQRRIGLLYMNLERYQEAEQHLRTALRLDPLSSIARINLAELYYTKRDWPAEERELRLVLAANPSYTLARVMLAFNFAFTNRCAEADSIARTLLADPEGAGWWPSMANLLVRCGDPGPARKMLESDNPPGSAEQVAVLFADWPKAIRHIQRIAASSPVEAWLIAKGTDRARYDASPEIRAIFLELEARVKAAQ